MLRGEHQHQRGTVAQDQQVSSGEEDAQVRAPAVHIGEHRAQAGREADPAATAEHPGIGAEGVAEEARGAGGFEALAVGGLRFPFTLGQVLLLAAAASRAQQSAVISREGCRADRVGCWIQRSWDLAAWGVATGSTSVGRRCWLLPAESYRPVGGS